MNGVAGVALAIILFVAGVLAVVVGLQIRDRIEERRTMALYRDVQTAFERRLMGER